MRNVPDVLVSRWQGGVFVGNTRNVCRATIQRMKMVWTNNGEWVYGSALFPQVSVPRELPNVRKLVWDRDTQTPTAGATLEMYNFKALPIGTVPPGWPAKKVRFGQPGYYTPRRGVSTDSSTLWSQVSNEWRDWLVYDRVIRTYEGYGFDPTKTPENDPNLVLTGVWLVSDLDFGVGGSGQGSGGDYSPPGATGASDGVISVTLKDFGRLATDDHILFPPIVPVKKFPLHFDPYTKKRGKDKITVSTAGTGWTHPKYKTDSNVPYVGNNGLVYGHRPTMAFSKDPNYWLSIGNADPDSDYAFEYIEGEPDATTIAGVKAKVWGGPYRVYLSIKKTDGKWYGHATIPYNPKDPISAPNGANVKFVDHKHCDANDWVYFKSPFKNGWTDVSRVRITFHHLTNSGLGPYPYRAGVRNFLTTGDTTTVTRTPTYYHTGYKEYSDIFKILCGMAGFFWPLKDPKLVLSDNTVLNVGMTRGDPALGPVKGNKAGRIWGDIQNSGTGPISSITAEQLDKQPIYSAIQVIQETLGFLFMVDETGGVVWRMPNIFQLGNWVLGTNMSAATPITNRPTSPANGDPAGSYTAIPQTNGRTSHYVTISENQQLVGLGVKLSGANVRERVFVGNLSGRKDGKGHSASAVTKGWNPYPSAMRRVAGWLDQHFETKEECKRMADMIALAQYMTIWTDTVTIPGNPQIQVDDQVLIQEETTTETDFHYVQAIHSENDMENGGWSYGLTTNWLGKDPSTPGKWIFKPSNFSTSTQSYLRGLKLL